MTKPADKKQIVVIGDIHSRLDLAFDGLNELEREHGAIDQVFSVGDAGLFLCADDWNYLAGPKKYRHPEQSRQITAAWQKWRWPMAMIGGNHEPYHRLRIFDPVHFGPKLSYTDAGILEHQIPDLRVYGLSGIFHPTHLGFGTVGHRGHSTPRGWADLATLAMNNAIARRQLSYYKQQDLDLLLRLRPEPDLLLIHDCQCRHLISAAPRFARKSSWSSASIRNGFAAGIITFLLNSASGIPSASRLTLSPIKTVLRCQRFCQVGR